MNGTITEVTAVSTKGQIVLPKAIRDALSLTAGSKLIVMSDGANILMKPIATPALSEFSSLMDSAKNWAESNGMQESDINDAVKAVRQHKRSTL